MDHLDLKLKNAAYDQLGQFGHPEMPLNFHQKLTTITREIQRQTNIRLISITEGFQKIREWATEEYLRIYPFED